MSKIRIKNFGPIKDGFKETLPDGTVNEWMDVKKVTVFIGNQGSGKSTVAKVISTMLWFEKAINRGDIDPPTNLAQLLDYFKYQRINNYFQDDTVIEYQGERTHFIKNSENPFPLITQSTSNKYIVPKIMYVPSERNFLSVIKNPFEVRDLPGSLNTFAKELRNFQNAIIGKLIDLPVKGIKFRHDRATDISYLVGEDYELNILESSSGYQSLIPLFLVTKFLNDELQMDENQLRDQLNANQSIRRNKEIAEIMFNPKLNEKQKSKKVREIDARYLNTCFINIVEEPEQNLFPSSQKEILYSLLGFNNMRKGNKLIMTTHSPYLINYLTLAVKADELKAIIKTEEHESKLTEIVPKASTVNHMELVIYQLDETDGSIKKLGNFEGIPSDNNFLNKSLALGNQLFDSLLEIEEEL